MTVAKFKMVYFLVLITVLHSFNCNTTPFSRRLCSELRQPGNDSFFSLLNTSYADTLSTHPPVEERHCCGLRSASLGMGMLLDWSSPPGCWCPQSALRLTSALPSHYSPRAVGGQSYQVEWCYKINWMLRRGKCWRWWTEESPRWEPQLFPKTSEWIGMRLEAKQLDYRLGLQSELNMSDPTSVACRSSVTFCRLETLPAHVQCACQKLE